MKKLLAIFIFSGLVAIPSAYSQVMSKNAIGGKLESSDGIGPQFTYQRAVGDRNRFEFDLGFTSHPHYDALKLNAYYHWVFNIVGGLNWYLGFGGGVGFIDADHDYYKHYPDYNPDATTAFASANGDFGLEYSFLEQGVPLQLALDLTPALYFAKHYYRDRYIDNGTNFEIHEGFAIRYQF